MRPFAIMLFPLIVTTAESIVLNARFPHCEIPQQGASCELPEDQPCCKSDTDIAMCDDVSMTWQVTNCLCPCSTNNVGVAVCDTW
jgi:hypothetical protein